MFAVAYDCKRLFTEMLSKRSQREGETLPSYNEDVLWLCRKVDPDMSESGKLSHLMKGVVEDAFQLLVLNGSSTVSVFTKSCNTLEDMQRSRLNKSTFHRLPNVAAPFSPPVDAAHIRVLVREVVREELRIILPEHFHSSFETPLLEPSLEDIIREEVHSDFSMLYPSASSSRLPECNAAAFSL